jgi:hypothetical protein
VRRVFVGGNGIGELTSRIFVGNTGIGKPVCGIFVDNNGIGKGRTLVENARTGEPMIRIMPAVPGSANRIPFGDNGNGAPTNSMLLAVLGSVNP